MQAIRVPAFRLLTGIVAIAMATVGLMVVTTETATADTFPPIGTPSTVSADGLQTWQLNGVVWKQVVVGNTVYATGAFTTARPPGVAVGGAGQVAANNIFAYDITTGNRVASFNHSLNGQGLSITKSLDGSRIYVVGDFTTVDGIARSHIAAFNTATNALDTSFLPTVSAKVSAVTASNDTVWFGGNFFSVNGQARTRLGAVRASNGAVLPWAPKADDNQVTSMVLTPDASRVIVGGKFTTLNGVVTPGMGSVDSLTGANMPWAASQTINDSGNGASITSLSTDGTNIYGTGYAFQSGDFEGTFSANPSTGSINFLNDCHGDTYDAFPIGSVLYSVSHAHDCRWIGAFPQTDANWAINMRHALAFTTYPTGTNTGPDNYGWNYNGLPDSTLLQWFPVLALGSYTGQNQAAWSVSGNSDYVVLGGEFPSVNGVAQQSLVRFAVKASAPNKRGPTKVSGAPATSAQAMPGGVVRVAWQSAVDMDNASLTYNVYRSDKPTVPIYTTTANSNYWTYPMLGFRDTKATAGTSYTYTVKVNDPSNNLLNLGASNAVTPSAANAASAYSSDVTGDGATAYWRLGENSGSTVYDYANFNDATASAGVARGAAGAIIGDSDKASTFDGASDGLVVSPQMAPTPDFSVEAWIKTSTTSGGKIIGYGGSNTGDSGSYDRHVYMDNSGHVIFGVYTGDTKTVASTKTYNDNAWHHIVASQSSTSGMSLYVDGKKIASDPSTTTAQDYTGYWRIGGDNLGGWPNQPSSNYFNGTIDDVAVYPSALSLAKVKTHYTDSGRSLGGPATPADIYGKVVYGDGPDLYWRLGDAPGSNTALDYSGNQADGVYSGGVTLGQNPGVSGTSDTSASFDGVSGTVGSASAVSNPSVYSEELWFNTSTNHGGKLIGFGDQQSGNSGNYDRHVYMENSGQLTFGVWTGQTNTITSPNAYNNGAWHHMVATQGPDGMKLYVDGALVGTNPQTQAQSYTGYWRVGGDTDWGGDSYYFNGKIDEVAVYSKVLDANTVVAHFKAGGGQLPNTSPQAGFTSSSSGLTASLDGTSSFDPDGSIAGYNWDFGDGSAHGTGQTPNHLYGAPGTYHVTLTVTDNQGATGSVTHDVSVTAAAANQKPTALFTTTQSDLTVTPDGSGSTDPDGTIASYDWNWGDGSAHGTVAKPSHTYGAAGPYTITLTVTDNQGATDTTTHDVTVTAANQKPTASFSTTQSNLTVTPDGSASKDTDGTIAGYDWNWGDGSAHGTGAKPSHDYASPGPYTITLTVTDDQGATDTVSHDVTVTAAANPALAADAFGRTMATGWGAADTGGNWVLKGATANFAVGTGVGSITMTKGGNGSWAYLDGVSSSQTDSTVTVSARKVATGGGIYAYLIGREVSAGGGYRAALNLRANGSVSVVINRRTAAGAQTTVGQAVVVPGMTWAAGDKINMRFVVAGSGTTALKVKVWAAGTSEPAAWLVDAADSTADFQGAGRVGLMAYLATNATNAPVIMDFDNYAVNAAN